MMNVLNGLSTLHPVSINSNRVMSYVSYKDELDFQGIEFPVDSKQINKFEKQNDVSVNVYYLKKKGKNFDVLPLHLTSCKKEKHVNLLFVESHYVDEEEDGEPLDDTDIVFKNHYIWIKDLSRLVRSQISKHKSKTFICDRCLHFFWSNEKLTKHVIDCSEKNECKILLPTEKNNILQFKNFSNKNQVPFIIYADFECLLKESNEVERTYQHHEPFSVGFFVKCSYDDRLSEYKCYRRDKEEDESPAKWFVMSLRSLALKLEEMYKNPKPMKDMTLQEKIQFSNAHLCYICQKLFTETDQKVRDHCHFTGKCTLQVPRSCT